MVIAFDIFEAYSDIVKDLNVERKIFLEKKVETFKAEAKNHKKTEFGTTSKKELDSQLLGIYKAEVKRYLENKKLFKETKNRYNKTWKNFKKFLTRNLPKKKNINSVFHGKIDS